MTVVEPEMFPDYLEVRILRLEPGDRLAIRSQRKMTKEQAEAIQASMVKLYPGIDPPAIFGPDLELIIIRES